MYNNNNNEPVFQRWKPLKKLSFFANPLPTFFMVLFTFFSALLLSFIIYKNEIWMLGKLTKIKIRDK